MTVMTQRILAEALQLPQDERVEMARALLRSVSTPAVPSGAEEAEGELTFSEKWRGKFEPAERDGERYKALSRRYPEVQSISGLVPSDVDAKTLYREHLLKKHR